MGMPNEFSFEPLPASPLITKLHTDLINISLNMLHSPFTEPNPLPAILHHTDMLVHGLRDCGMPNRGMILHQGQCFHLLLASQRSRRRQRGPCIVESTQQKDCRNCIADEVCAE